MFTTFPARWPGVGLLLLRTAVGVVVTVEGGAYVGVNDAGSVAAMAVGLLLAASGAALLVGFLTPLAAALIASCTASLGLSWLPPPTPNLLSDGLTIVLLVIVACAIGLLGPGAYSLDSYLFGRREIMIAARARD